MRDQFGAPAGERQSDYRSDGRRERTSRIHKRIRCENGKTCLALLRDSRAGPTGFGNLDGRFLETWRRVELVYGFVRRGAQPGFLGRGQSFVRPLWRRPQGANLYTDSLVALDADTGKLRWYFQETPHDVYDYDSNPEPVLIDVQLNGQMRKLVIHSSKNGFAYVLDRETGKFVRGFPYVDTVTWTKGLDKDGKPVDPVMEEAGKVDKDYLFCPGTQGGRNRNHSAYSPQTGLWYTTALEVCSHLTPQKQQVNEGESFWGGQREEQLNPNAVPHIAAFDPLTGKKQWSFATRFFNASSLLATAGDLVFGGDIEGSAFALDAKTGQKLWSFNTGSRIASPAVSFSVNGRQYVAIDSGGGSLIEARAPLYWPEAKNHIGQDASTLFVFALPDEK